MPISQIALPLFLPATRLDRLAKAQAAGADAILLDLEDAVAEEDKANARAALRDLPARRSGAVPVLVRLNAADSAFYAEDVAVLGGLAIDGLILPKAEDAETCAVLAAQTGLPVIGLIETALGLRRAESVARACTRLAFGSIDYAADLGIAHTREALLHARAELVLASRLANRPAPWDGVTQGINDEAAILSDCQYSVEMGFGGKLIIHPAQIAPARRGFAPSEAELDCARRVVAACSETGAAIKLDGQMIDAPVVKRAQQILARAGGAA